MKRKDALWVMQMCRDRDARSEAEREAFDTAIEALKSESIFSADRPRGEWMEPTSEAIEKRIYGSCEVVCSVCEAAAVDFYDFCPNCGADMRGEDE